MTEVADLLAVEEDYLKISAYFKDGVPPVIQERMREFVSPHMRPVVSGLPWLDFLPSDCNKGTALAVLQDVLGITREKTLAFGDNENDVELLQQAGVGCAMASGNPVLRAVANREIKCVSEELWHLLQGIHT